MPWDQVMGKWKAGTLKSGGSGKTVKSQTQAVAIMLSEKRKSKTVPEYRGSASNYKHSRPKRKVQKRSF
jgi:Family of unknown function (DUF6496)